MFRNTAGHHRRNGWRSPPRSRWALRCWPAVLRGVNRSGALAGGLACFLLFAGAGPAAFADAGGAVSDDLGRPPASDIAASWHSGSPSAAKAGTPGRFWPIWQCRALASLRFGVTGNRAWLVAAVGGSGRSRDRHGGQRNRAVPRLGRAADHDLGNASRPAPMAESRFPEALAGTGRRSGDCRGRELSAAMIHRVRSSGFQSPPDSPEC